MPNNYFQFQQFRIAQADCAQKVSTDACILGAAADLTSATRVLDLGTGTGLLALMAAQRAPAATIEAIEIDAAAATQAAANVAASPWADRMQVRPLSLAAYATTQPAPFSHIICNPPFFRRSLVSLNAARNAARHESEDSLAFGDIIGFAASYLLPAGTLTLLLPPTEMQQFEQEAQADGLWVQARLLVQHRPSGRITRCISTFGREILEAVPESKLVIQETDGVYSAAFRALLSGFYLAL